MKKVGILISASIVLLSCNKNNEKADAYGNFEATEITVSSESNGKIEFLNVQEGAQIKKGTFIGLIDTLQLHFNREQLKASIETVKSRSASVLSQIEVLNEQLKTAKIEQNRIKNMFAENAATKRQVDEIEGKVKVIEKQINSVQTQNAPILNEIKSIVVQIEKLELF
jgi:HlyD family secretion protein